MVSRISCEPNRTFNFLIMIQEILTYIVIFSAIGITLFKFLQSFGLFGKKKSYSSSCSSCSAGSCSGCSFNTTSNNKPQFPVKVLHDELK